MPGLSCKTPLPPNSVEAQIRAATENRRSPPTQVQVPVGFISSPTNCLNNYDKPGIVFTNPPNLGEFWTHPNPLNGQLGYNDMPELLVSPSGEDVYVAFNSNQNLYVAESHDARDTFPDPVLATNEKLWYHPYGGATAANSTVNFADAGESGNPADVNKQNNC